mgnify:CR=1 FL=1
MNTTVEQLETTPSVTILKIQGDLDGSSYQSLIRQAQELYASGTRHLLLDLSEMPFMSSAGLVGLHTVVTVMHGDQPPDMEGGWSVIHEITHSMDSTSDFDPYCKLLNPQPRVEKTLEMTGFTSIVEIFTDRETAVASF